jgi:hypothetical protein
MFANARYPLPKSAEPAGKALARLGIPVLPLVLAASTPASAQIAGAPAIPAFGAYFPSWLICAALGILGAILIRVVFVRIGLDDVLPVRLPVYVALAFGLAIIASKILFGL